MMLRVSVCAGVMLALVSVAQADASSGVSDDVAHVSITSA